MLRECGQLLDGKRFPLNVKTTVYKRSIRPTILSGSETRCMKKAKLGSFKGNRSMMRAMCCVQPKDRRRAKNLMLLLELKETIDRSVMAKVCIGMEMY